MKKSPFYFLILVMFSFVTGAFAQDDVYFDPDAESTKSKKSTKYSNPNDGYETYSSDVSEGDDLAYYAADDFDYEDEDEYDYYYSSRIKRFKRSYSGFNYYAPVYTDAYYYDPFYTPGVSIYVTNVVWRPRNWYSPRNNYVVYSNYGYNNYGYNNYGYNNYGYNNYGGYGYNGYNNGYSYGYGNGYSSGAYNPYYCPPLVYGGGYYAQTATTSNNVNAPQPNVYNGPRSTSTSNTPTTSGNPGVAPNNIPGFSNGNSSSLGKNPSTQNSATSTRPTIGKTPRAPVNTTLGKGNSNNTNVSPPKGNNIGYDKPSNTPRTTTPKQTFTPSKPRYTAPKATPSKPRYTAPKATPSKPRYTAPKSTPSKPRYSAPKTSTPRATPRYSAPRSTPSRSKPSYSAPKSSPSKSTPSRSSGGRLGKGGK